MTEKVISIVERLEQRQMDRLRKLSDQKHIRELEAQVEWLDYKKSLETIDFDVEIEATDDPREQAKLRCVRGLKRCFAGDVDGGQAEWHQVIAEIPDLSLPHICLARWIMQTDPTAALPHFDHAATAEPDDPTVYARRGDCYVRLEDYPRAIANYRRALAIDSTSIDCLYAMGKALVSTGEVEEAIKFYDQAIARGPRYTDFYMSRAIALGVLDRHKEALADLDRVIEIDAKHGGARLLRSRALGELDRTGEAMEDLEWLDRAEPNQHLVLVDMGKLHLSANQLDKAIEAFTRAIEVAPEHDEAYHQRALALLRSEKFDEATADMRRAVDLAPKRAESAYILLALEGRPKTPAERLEDLDAAVDKHPDFPLIRERRAEILAETGQHEKALADFDLLIDRWKLEPTIHVERAKSRASVGNLEGALEDAEKAVELDPTNATAFAMRAAYRSALVESDDRIGADYARAVELKPNDATIRYYRAHWLMDNCEYVAGLENFDKVLELVPKHAEAHYSRAYCRFHLEDDANVDFDEWEEPEAEVLEERNRLALADIERAIELGHFDEETADLLYWVRRDLDGIEAAGAVLDASIEKFPTSAWLLRTRASWRREMKDMEGSAVDEARATELAKAESEAVNAS